MLDSREKSRVAVFCDFYLPGFRAGGPPISISRIVESERDAEVRVITRDREAPHENPYPSALPREWTRCGNALVAYLRPGATDWPWVVRQLRQWKPDLLYFNSLHSPWFSLLPQFLHRIRALPASNVLLAPRGEASAGAQALKKAKKASARPLIKLLASHPLTWHASSDREESDVRAWWGNSWPSHHRVLVIANPGPEAAPMPSRPPLRMRPRIVYASRIDPMKGLHDLIEGMCQVSVAADLHIHGTVTDHDYWRKCQNLVRSLPANIECRYLGEYLPSNALQILSDADLFVLPTRGENFGQVIAEALSVGCPVAIPKTTIWTSIAHTCGYVVESPDQIACAVHKFALLSHEERRRQREITWSEYRDYETRNALRQSLFSLSSREAGWPEREHPNS